MKTLFDIEMFLRISSSFFLTLGRFVDIFVIATLFKVAEERCNVIAV